MGPIDIRKRSHFITKKSDRQLLRALADLLESVQQHQEHFNRCSKCKTALTRLEAIKP